MGIGLRVLFFVAVAPFISAWSLMIVIGIVHAEVAPVVMAVGYWPCVGISFLTCFVAALFAVVNVAGSLMSAMEMY